jgi:hypothetical protein
MIMITCTNVWSSYSTTNYNYKYLKSLLKHIHETRPNIISMCRILELVATNLVRNH